MTPNAVSGARGLVRRVAVSWLALAAALVVSACGGSSNPSTPTSISLAGSWTGTFSYTTGGVMVTDDATLTLTQPSTTASGAWTTGSLTNGTVSFLAASSITGSFTIVQPNVGSSACSASSSISGTASSSDLVINVADIAPTASCPWGTGLKFVLHK